MPDIRVRLTHPAYPDIDETGVLVLAGLDKPTLGLYSTFTIRRDDGSLFRSEGVLRHASQ